MAFKFAFTSKRPQLIQERSSEPSPIPPASTFPGLEKEQLLPAATPTSPDYPPASRTSAPSTDTPPISLSAAKTDPLSSSPPHLDAFKWFDNVIFELHGVFLESPDDSAVDKRTRGIRYDIMTSSAWSRFEKGLIDYGECQAQICTKLELSKAEVSDAFDAAMSWRISQEMLALALELQRNHCIYAIGNLPQPGFDTLQKSLGGLELFKNIFVSSELKESLPYCGILTKALQAANLDPERTLYIGNHIDSIITTRSFGFHAIKCVDRHKCIQHVLQICHDPIASAKAWLQANAGKLDLETSLGITVKDAYMQFCILDATNDKSLIYYDPDERLFSWYYGPVPNGLQPFPPDVDCNSLAYSVLDHLDDAACQSMMDKMLQYIDSSGILQSYLSHEKIRIDALMCVNGLALFHEHGRGHQLAATEEWIFKVLCTRAFRDGTHYYPSPDLFLYYVSRLLRKAPTLRARFGPVLRDWVLERMEADGDALGLAARVIAGARCGVRNDAGMAKLLALQRGDGSWDKGVVYRFTRVEGVAWHKGFTVALAVLAIEEWEFLRRR